MSCTAAHLIPYTEAALIFFSYLLNLFIAFIQSHSRNPIFFRNPTGIFHSSDRLVFRLFPFHVPYPFVITLEYAVFVVTPGSRPIFPDRALITS